MRFEGTVDIRAPQRVWDFLADLGKVATAVPGLESPEVVEAGS